ncbi:glutathione S-transferase N-terminal domain-containing protein [Altererythrobacter sp.]|nr:glutathione S-transferase N-terminal domain-containing protein [Altererythrobacter sp.]
MYKLYGALASPYSMKMRSILRYRRLPFTWHDGPETQEALKQVRAPVIPVLEFPGGGHANDSTPLIYDLEGLHPERSIVPPDPAVALLAHLIEDFADEWLTKAMFGWRWLADVDQIQMSRWLAFDRMHGGGLAASQAAAAIFRERQVGRMAVVGCTQENFPLIEASTRAILQALEDHVTDSFFLFGTRPSLAEFGLMAQLSQLAVDPTPQAMMRADYPYTFRWLMHLDDLSGHEGEWSEKPSAAALAIARIAGQVYAPYLTANAAALEAGDGEFTIEAMGLPYTQGTFKYQAKCLVDLRTHFAALDSDAAVKAANWIGPDWCAALAQ